VLVLAVAAVLQGKINTSKLSAFDFNVVMNMNWNWHRQRDVLPERAVAAEARLGALKKVTGVQCLM